MGYWYWCATCPGCKATQVFGYAGAEADLPKGPDRLSISVPSPNLITCKSCGNVHDYRLGDIRPRKLPQAPPHMH